MTLGFGGMLQSLSSSPLQWENFDAPNGTVINGYAGAGGISWTDASLAVSIQNGYMVSTANCYPAAQYISGGVLQPLTGIWGTFVIAPGTAPTERPLTIIGDADTPSLQNMMHFTFGLNGGELTIRQSGGAFVVLYPAQWNILPGVEYQVGMVFDQVAGTWALFGPDGSATGKITDSRVTTLGMTTARFQIGGLSSPSAAKWGSIVMGKSRASALGALAGSAPMQEVTSLRSVNRSIAGTKSVAPSVNTSILQFNTAGPQIGNRIKLFVDAYIESTALPGVATACYEWSIPILSTSSVNVLGTPTYDHYNIDNSGAGISMSLSPSFTISGQALTMGITPNISGGNAGYVTGVMLCFKAEALGATGGSFLPL